MNIEQALKIDAQKLTELTMRSKAYWNYDKEQLEAWREELTVTKKYIEENKIYKLLSNNVLLGFYAYKAENKTDIKLHYLFIAPEYIGTGLGHVLMKDFLRRVENSGFQRVILDADPNAEKFYSKLGFKVIGKLQSAIKGRYLPIMELKISSLHKNKI